MAHTHKYILSLKIYILLISLISGSTQSVRKIVEHTTGIAEKQDGDNNDTDILLELKAVLSQVKNKIYHSNSEIADNLESQIKEDTLLPTPSITDDSLRKEVPTYKQTCQTTAATFTKKERTLNNWLAVITAGSTQYKDELKKKLEDEITRCSFQETNLNPCVSTEHSIADDISEESENRNHPDEKQSGQSNATKNVLISSDSPSINDNNLNYLVEKTGVENGSFVDGVNITKGPTETDIPDKEIRSPHDDPIVIDSPVSDSAKSSDSGKIETYNQFAERLSAEKKNGGPEVIVPVAVKLMTKVKTKNYAGQDCGAKVLSANPGAEFPGHVINRNRDEYMLNKCNLEMTFYVIIELCESIKTQKFEIANFELFSNVPKDGRLYGSHRYPVRDWILIGEFQAEEGNRDVQSFVTDSDKFIKYVKLELTNYYGSEYYCPLSQFRIYGISEFDAIDHLEDDADYFEEEQQIVATTLAPKASGWNLKSLVANVLSVIKRGSISHRSNAEQDKIDSHCRSLDSNFAIPPEQCTSQEYLNYILSCYYDEYIKLLEHEAISTTVQNTVLCSQVSQSLCDPPVVPDYDIYATVCRSSYPCIMLSPKHFFALCYISNPLMLLNSSKCQSGDRLYITTETTTNNDSISYKNILASNDSAEHIQRNNESNEHRADPMESAVQNGKNSQIAEVDDIKNMYNGKLYPEKSSNDSVSQENADQAEYNDDANKNITQNYSGTSDGSSDASSSIEAKFVSHPSINKESIVVRLSNKIKVLEANVSISSQYLEELSQTYKRQMEEMKKQFNITITALNKSSQISFERDIFHHEQIESLEERLNIMNKTIELLIEWNHSMRYQVFLVHCVVILVEIIFFYAMYKHFARLLEAKISRTMGHLSSGKHTVENGKIPSRLTTSNPIHRSESDDFLNTANFNGFVNRSQEWVHSSQNSRTIQPSEPISNHSASVLNCNGDINIGRYSVQDEGHIENLSGSFPQHSDRNGVLLKPVKQVIPFRVDQRPVYEFSYSNEDFNAPVISDYYTVNAKPAQKNIQQGPLYSPQLCPIPCVPFNYETFQSYIQWCSKSMPSRQFNNSTMSETDSKLNNWRMETEPKNDAPILIPVDLNSNSKFSNQVPSSPSWNRKPDSSIRTTQDPDKSSMLPNDQDSIFKLANQDVDLEPTLVDSKLKEKIQFSNSAVKGQGTMLESKLRESDKQDNFVSVAQTIKPKFHDGGLKKQENSKKNKKKKKLFKQQN